MEDLQDFLKGKKYKKIKFTVLKTQHLLIKGKINGVKGNFILDTGASNSCVGFESVEHFKLDAQFSETKAAAVYWGIIKPECKPPEGAKNAGRSFSW